MMEYYTINFLCFYFLYYRKKVAFLYRYIECNHLVSNQKVTNHLVTRNKNRIFAKNILEIWKNYLLYLENHRI